MIFKKEIQFFVSAHRPVELFTVRINGEPLRDIFFLLLLLERTSAVNCLSLLDFSSSVVTDAQINLRFFVGIVGFDYLSSRYFFIFILLLSENSRKNFLLLCHLLFHFLHSINKNSLCFLYFLFILFFLYINFCSQCGSLLQGLSEFFCFREGSHIIYFILLSIFIDSVFPDL